MEREVAATRLPAQLAVHGLQRRSLDLGGADPAADASDESRHAKTLEREQDSASEA